MDKTKHFQTRMNQRAIRSELIDLVIDYGTAHGDKIVLDQRNIKDLLESIDRLRGRLTKVMDKGGLVIVEDQGVLITGYRLDR